MPNTISLLGIVALAALFLSRRGGGGLIDKTNSAAAPDWWLTPFYLRYNTPVPSDQMAILPTGGAGDSWSLAVPQP